MPSIATCKQHQKCALSRVSSPIQDKWCSQSFCTSKLFFFYIIIVPKKITNKTWIISSLISWYNHSIAVSSLFRHKLLFSRTNCVDSDDKTRKIWSFRHTLECSKWNIENEEPCKSFYKHNHGWWLRHDVSILISFNWLRSNRNILFRITSHLPNNRDEIVFH